HVGTKERFLDDIISRLRRADEAPDVSTQRWAALGEEPAKQVSTRIGHQRFAPQDRALLDLELVFRFSISGGRRDAPPGSLNRRKRPRVRTHQRNGNFARAVRGFSRLGRRRQPPVASAGGFIKWIGGFCSPGSRNSQGLSQRGGQY